MLSRSISHEQKIRPVANGPLRTFVHPAADGGSEPNVHDAGKIDLSVALRNVAA
jgi:hypothetical protein